MTLTGRDGSGGQHEVEAVVIEVEHVAGDLCVRIPDEGAVCLAINHRRLDLTQPHLALWGSGEGGRLSI